MHRQNRPAAALPHGDACVLCVCVCVFLSELCGSVSVSVSVSIRVYMCARFALGCEVVDIRG